MRIEFAFNIFIHYQFVIIFCCRQTRDASTIRASRRPTSRLIDESNRQASQLFDDNNEDELYVKLPPKLPEFLSDILIQILPRRTAAFGFTHQFVCFFVFKIASMFLFDIFLFFLFFILSCSSDAHHQWLFIQLPSVLPALDQNAPLLSPSDLDGSKLQLSD